MTSINVFALTTGDRIDAEVVGAERRQALQHPVHTGNKQEMFGLFPAVPVQPVDEGNHLVIQANGISQAQQRISGRFDPHYHATGGIMWVMEKETGQKARHLVYLHIIGVA